jgi:UDP-N-acetylglucosamine acyltransferase
LTPTHPTRVHPTAVVSPGAELGAGVVVGPYCVVEEGARIGDGCRLDPYVHVFGGVSLGDGCVIGTSSVLGGEPQDLKYAGEPTGVTLGERCRLHEHVTVHRATGEGQRTTVGNDVLLMTGSHIGHNSVVDDRVILVNGALLAGHAHVGEGAILSGHSAVHQFCRVGRLAITGGCSKIVQDVPPYMIADGNPARVRGVNTVGLKRRGHSEEAIRKLKEAHRVIFRKGLNAADRDAELAVLAEDCDEVALVREFIRSSERGIVR